MFAGCSPSPSSGDGERAIQGRIKEQSGGRIKLTKFEKTNGAQGELMGFKIYALEFNAEIEFAEDCKWAAGALGQQLSFSTSKAVVESQSGFSWDKFLDDTTNPGALVKKGQRVQLSGVVRYLKKEKGWAVDGIEISKAAPIVGSVESAVHSLREKAERGDANAQYELGKMYATGKGAEKDVVEAVKWLKRSAEQGFAKGQHRLGVMYWSGQGVERNDREAVKLFRMAAAQGDTAGQCSLGVAYTSGRGVDKNEIEGVKLIRKAAEAGDVRAQQYLGESYLQGESVEKDYAEAAKWLRKAAEQNDPASQCLLGQMHKNGEGVPRNRDIATEWYRKAAMSDDHWWAERANEALRSLDPAVIASRQCHDNLKEISLAFREWAILHDRFPFNRFPFNVSTRAGGTMEFSARGSDGFEKNAALHFQVLSNELKNPKILICPADSGKHPAADFRSLLPANVTYQIRSSSNVDETYPEEILMLCPIHDFAGYCDGSVRKRKRQ